MVRIRRVFAAFAALGCFLAPTEGDTRSYAPAEFIAGGAYFALANQELKLNVEDVVLPNQAGTVQDIITKLNNLAFFNKDDFVLTEKFSQAQQYGWLNILNSIVFSQRELARQAVLKREYFTSENETAAWVAYFKTVAQAIDNTNRTVDSFAPEVAPAVRFIIAFDLPRVSEAIAAYGG